MSMAKQDVNLSMLHKPKRPELSKHFTIEIKPEASNKSGPIPIVSPEVHEDWLLVSAKTSSYYDMIVSKLNSLDKSNLMEENLRSLRNQQDTDWEFWASVITDFHKVLLKDHEKFRHHLSKGIPPPLRGMLWQIFSEAANDALEEKYRQLLNESSSYEKLIKNDLPRAFPDVDYFNTDKGQEGLFHVIKAYSLLDEEVGYCQGIHFLVGCLLLHMPEEAAFGVLIKLMSKYELREQYTPKMEKLHKRMFQFEQLLSIHLPQVHRHLDAQGVLPSMYASQWFMTLFVYRCPLNLVFAIFDVILVEGADMMLNFGLALIKKNQQAIVCLDFESLLEFFNGHVFDVYKENASDLVQDAYSFHIPSKLLCKFTKQYAIEAEHQERVQCIEDDVKRKNMELSEKLKRLRQAYKTLDTEYQEVAQELVQAKMSMATLDEQNQSLKHELSVTRSHIQKTEEDNEYKGQLNRLSDSNIQLANENSTLQDRLTKLEAIFVEFKLKQAKSLE